MHYETAEEERQEQVLEFMKDMSEALQELVVVLKQFSDNGVEIASKLDRLIALAEAPPAVVHLHQPAPLHDERDT